MRGAGLLPPLGRVSQGCPARPTPSRGRATGLSQAHFPTVETSLEHLDLATIIRMSQAVAGELLLDRLIETLMTIGRVAHDLAPRRMRFEEREGAASFVYSPTAPSESVAPEHAEDVVVALVG